jgi:hypothetical protein
MPRAHHPHLRPRPLVARQARRRDQVAAGDPPAPTHRRVLRLGRTSTGIAVDHARVALESVDLSQAAPAGYYADAVAILRDRAAALRLPELATLSVMAHPELEIAGLAIEAISKLPTDRRQLYLDVILSALPPAVRKILEARMQGYEYQSEFARKYYGQCREDGRQEGPGAVVDA